MIPGVTYCTASRGGRQSKWGNVVAVAAAMIFVAGSASAAISRSTIKKQSATVESVPGEMIVKVRRAGTGIQGLRSALGALSRQIESIDSFETDSQLVKVRLKAGFSVASAIDQLKSSDQVEYAEPNFIYRAMESGVPNDARFGELWGILNAGQRDSQGTAGRAGVDINVVPVWATGITGSKNITVAVIDTGIQWDHVDLQDNLYINRGESGSKAKNGIDDDGNGFIDDVHGWNFHANTASSTDDQGHGTHCAGTIGGSGNNGIGVAGVNWNVTLMPIKFLGADGGGTLQGAIESVNYARLMKVDIMSNSWGGGGASQALRDAIQQARDAGILFVAAAGNDGSDNDTRPTYPAAYPVDNVLAVSAINNAGGIADFSNYGKTSVHVAAPGVNVLSSYTGGGYRAASGTSMACPHVSGVAALVLSANPGMSFADLKDRLIKTSQPLASVKRKVVSKGMVSAFNAINNIVPPSGEPDPTKWEDVAVNIESPHPYTDKINLALVVEEPGVKFIRVFFERIDTEARYDVVSVEAESGEVVDSYSGKHAGVMSEAVQGSRAVIRLKADDTVNGWGFKVSRIQVIR
jgi:thermitase